MARWRRRPRKVPVVDEWITREFAARGLSPPHCTPEALAQALERKRQITIEWRAHASDDPGVYGLLYRKEGCGHTYIILTRPTHSIVLHRLTLFHELAHILFNHPLTEAAGVGGLRGYMVSDQDDAVAEAFAVGAMQYSFLAGGVSTTAADAEDEVSASAFGQLLMQTWYAP
jgi:hypothetical protein